MKEKIEALFNECKNYVESHKKPEEPLDLFDHDTQVYQAHFIALHYFWDVLLAISEIPMSKEPEFISACLKSMDLSGSATEVMNRINAGGHPFRDALILVNHDCLQDGDKEAILSRLEILK